MNLRIVICCLCMSAAPLLAGDFWQDKDPSQWSEKEITRLRENSPWARDASVQFNMGQMGATEGGPGGGMGRGGGMGGPPPGGAPPDMGPGGPGGGMPSPKMVVRWESAVPLLDAENRGQAVGPQTIAQWAREFYVIGVSGLQGGAGRGGQEQGEGQEARTPRGTASMKAVTSLKRKGREAIYSGSRGNVADGQGPRDCVSVPAHRFDRRR
jgi:hypothetical protein